MNKPKLYIMTGLSGSGKSTIAQKLAEENPNTVIVS
jgi:adenylylsulfate kinase-like enzyme